MIDAAQLREALRPRFGSRLTAETGFGLRTVRMLQLWKSGSFTLAEMAARVEEALFNDLYDYLGPGMSVPLDGGGERRIRVSELPDAADDAMGVLFDQFPADQEHCDLLHAYCMDTGSFSALRALYLRFRSFLPEEEVRIIARVIRNQVSPARWEGWLNPADCGPGPS